MDSTRTARRALVVGLGFLAASLAAPATAESGRPEKAEVTLAIGGVSPQMYFLPVVLADRLGYFEKAGVKVTRTDMGSGTKALQAVVSGGADVAAGSFEHPIRMQARGQDIKAFVKFGLYHGNVLGIGTRHVQDYKTPADMKGWKIGVSSPGSSSHQFAVLLLAKYGVKPSEVSFIAVTQGPGGVAAMRTGGELDAVSLTDPSITRLESSGDIKVVADSRTLEGTVAAYGGETISGSMYTTGAYMEKNPNTVQALTNGILGALAWMKKASAEEIMAKLPPEYLGTDKDLYRTMLEKNITSFQHDGTFSMKAAEVTLDFLRKTDPELKDVTVDLSKTYDPRFVEAARANPRPN